STMRMGRSRYGVRSVRAPFACGAEGPAAVLMCPRANGGGDGSSAATTPASGVGAVRLRRSTHGDRAVAEGRRPEPRELLLCRLGLRRRPRLQPLRAGVGDLVPLRGVRDRGDVDLGLAPHGADLAGDHTGPERGETGGGDGAVDGAGHG